MAGRIMFCPRCMNRIHKNDVRCSQCGMEVCNMQKPKKEIIKDVDQVDMFFPDQDLSIGSNNENQSVEKVDKQTENQNRSIKEDVDYREDPQDVIDSTEIGCVVYGEANKPKRHKHRSKQKKSDRPQYTVDESGEYNIDTSDVTYLEGIENPTYSVKKARGETVKVERLKWWEIYKWADRMLAKRKMMKEVNKASHKEPKGIKRNVMLVWCVLFGWLGIHNFYAHNNKRGWTVIVLDVIIGLVLSIPVLYENVGVFFGGGCGFTMMCMWFYDLFTLIVHKYRYRISKEEFISNLNVNSRAKLGKRYIGLDKTVFKEKEQKRLAKLNKKKRRAK